MSAVTNPASVGECLRVGAGFSQGDRNWIAEQFATLEGVTTAVDPEAIVVHVAPPKVEAEAPAAAAPVAETAEPEVIGRKEKAEEEGEE